MIRRAGWAVVLFVLASYSGRAAASPGKDAKLPDFKALQAEVDRAIRTVPSPSERGFLPLERGGGESFVLPFPS